MDLSLHSRVPAINGIRISYLDELLFYRYADGSVHIEQLRIIYAPKRNYDQITAPTETYIVYSLFYCIPTYTFQRVSKKLKINGYLNFHCSTTISQFQSTSNHLLQLLIKMLYSLHTCIRLNVLVFVNNTIHDITLPALVNHKSFRYLIRHKCLCRLT